MGNRTFFDRIREMAPGPVHAAEPLGCLKVGYDREGAERAARQFKQKAYRCPACGRWHLTKHEKFRWSDKGRRR